MGFSEYKDIYIIAESLNGVIGKEALEITGQARLLANELKERVCAVVIGEKVTDESIQLLIASGADEVYVLAHALLMNYDGKSYAKVVSKLCDEKKPSAVIFSATACGRDLAPRVAAELVCGVTADVTELSIDKESHLIIWSRPALGGNIIADIISPNYKPQMGTIRPGTFRIPSPDYTRHGEVIHVPVFLSEGDIGVVVKEKIPAKKEAYSLKDAEIVIAAGRGIRNKQEWDMVEELANMLHAGIGVTRPIIDQGWISAEHKVGQTGNNVTSKVYIALGISGAMQHMCAVKSDILVAVNNNVNAPIMDMADYSVESNLKDFLPAIIKELKKRSI
ncbi:MAG: electron transfer flavoprotein subunit alpha/FixB family protein [Dialister sp.]|nr:electron transfer flavoprotein subunit alpha/FixB family protein [Dialister sp.]